MDTIKKGLIISCVSALFIVVSKYLYQKYIQFVSVLREQNVKLFSMEKRIEKLESDYVSTVTPMMGGVQIPVQFRNVDKPTKQRDAKVIQFEHATPETVEMIENQKSSVESAKDEAAQIIRDSTDTFQQQTCEFDSTGTPLTETALNAMKQVFVDDIASFTSENMDGVKRRRGGRTRTKRPFANAKEYNNGDRIEEEGIEYVCVVGKKGGHSWKRADETTNDMDSVDTNGTV